MVIDKSYDSAAAPVQNRYAGMSNSSKYLSVCLTLTQVLAPVEGDDLMSNLIERLAKASDCVNKAVQVC